MRFLSRDSVFKKIELQPIRGRKVHSKKLQYNYLIACFFVFSGQFINVNIGKLPFTGNIEFYYARW